jgi:hypothetical protein
MIPILILLPACAVQQPQASNAVQKPLNDPPPRDAPVKESIFACLGVPAAGKKCGFDL